MSSRKAHSTAKKRLGEGDRVRSSGTRSLGRGEVQVQHKLIDHGQATTARLPVATPLALKGHTGTLGRQKKIK